MNKTEQAQQLRLAAELIETGHPLEWQQRDGKWYKCSSDGAFNFLTQGFPIRPILATPPDGRPLHNPDKLTAEQVGLGYRLGLQEESASQPHEVWTDGEWREAFKGDLAFINYGGTYRLPLSVPWPEVKADPYAELKAAHAAGKTIEVQMPNGEWFDYNPGDPQWNLQPECYRIKPEPPPFQLPPPPPGMRWHREDGWNEGDLPQGYRPLVEGEELSPGDEGDYGDGFMRFYSGNRVMYPQYLYRTTRPLVFTHEGKEWTWHKPGDPMPCGGEREVEALCQYQHNSLTTPIGCAAASILCWDNHSAIIGWRYAETTKAVELGPADVPPGSVIRSKDQPGTSFWTVSQVWTGGFYLRGESMPWDTARERMQINRSIPLTGKWDANAWEPCSKEVQA